ncbi:MAG: SseB family protein [Elusimicrobiota bacterium]
MPSKSPENPELLKALYQAAGGVARGHRATIFQELLRSTLILQAAKPSSGESPPQVRLIAMETPDGRKGICAFTDVGSLKAWRPGSKHLISMPGQAVFRMAAENGFELVLLNPGGPAWEVSGDDLRDLAQGCVPETTPGEGRKVRLDIGPPKEPIPPTMLEWLRRTLPAHPEILAAHLFTLTVGPEEAKLCLGLRLSLPLEGYRPFLRIVEAELAKAPSVAGGFSVGPVVDDMVEAVERFGLLVFKRG